MSEPLRYCAHCRALLVPRNTTQFCGDRCHEEFSENYWRTFLRRRASAAPTAAGGRLATAGYVSLNSPGRSAARAFSEDER